MSSSSSSSRSSRFGFVRRSLDRDKKEKVVGATRIGCLVSSLVVLIRTSAVHHRVSAARNSGGSPVLIGAGYSVSVSVVVIDSRRLEMDIQKTGFQEGVQ